ncbi:MAG: ATPase, P-type (transporting), superfamily, subfamily [Chthoniobacteraceae bacterium]|nr:ATPase, P-type (transporting), superfamily, subfamily [Chthoniobacteraceae bacterium]
MMSRDKSSWHQASVEEVLQWAGVQVETGLSAEEIKSRRNQYGPNVVSARPGVPAWLKFLRQFNQPLIYILIVAIGVTAFLGEWVDSAVISGVVLVNAIFGFLQEAKAEKAIEALAGMIVTEITVRRDGRPQRVHSEALVPGDVVLLQAGDCVPADLRLVRMKSLQVDESALTGESLPVFKHCEALPPDTILADRRNLAFAGTLVTAGQGEAIVRATGDRTEAGNIARLISSATETSTPLTKKIKQFSELILWVILGLAAATFLIGVIRGERAVEMFMAAVALAVGAIPEGLPAAVTVVLAIGVSRMAKQKAIIRKLPVVETLGSTTIICSDKTGTLTENQMTVHEIFAGGRFFEVTGSGYAGGGEIRIAGAPQEITNHPSLAEALRAGVLCNDAQIVRGDDGRLKVQGDPTEAAMLVAAEKGGLLAAVLHKESPRMDVIPFESEQMFRATLHDAPTGRVIYKVGAVERLLDRCADTLDEHGEITPLNKKAVHDAVAQMAARGLRVLAFVRLHVDSHHAKLNPGDVAAGLTFLGLQGMIDPPRPEAIVAVRRCQQAGIAVKMITGDHLITARAIATQIGIIGDEKEGELAALSGGELEKISDTELPAIAERTAVFARVAPEQKLRLVRALQSRGHIVAMTGDGVNDAPALKQADIGVAMGISGTDVAKGAAAMVLMDDNFASIEAAVEEGRGVFDNLTKFIVWILPTNLGEALLLITAIAFGLPLPALPLQLLWINLTDTILGLPLTLESKEADLMGRPPRDPAQPLLTLALVMRTGLVSLIMLGGGLGLFLWELRVEQAGLTAARTALVNVIVIIEAVYLFNCRSLNHSVFSLGLFSNRWAVAGSLTMVAVQLLFTCTPLMNKLFHSAPISGGCWLRIFGIAAVVFITVELEKWVRFARQPNNLAIPE